MKKRKEARNEEPYLILILFHEPIFLDVTFQIWKYVTLKEVNGL